MKDEVGIDIENAPQAPADGGNNVKHKKNVI